MAFNDSFDDSLGAVMILLIMMMSVFLYLSIHMISKTNATIPLIDDHNFGGHNLDSKLDLESNVPEITNLTLNDRLVKLLYFFLNCNFFVLVHLAVDQQVISYCQEIIHWSP